MDQQIEKYINKYPQGIVNMFIQIRELIYCSVKYEIKEILWASLPSYVFDIYFVRIIPFKDHINIESKAIVKYKEKLKEYKITPKGMLQIYLNQEIPFEILKKIFKESFVN